MASAARSALGAKGGSTHGALRLAGIRDTPSGQGLVRAWWPWLCPLWARSGLQGCSIPCGAIRKWWPGEWPQASPAGPSRIGALRRASRFLRMQKCAGLKCQ